jgi:LytS/YehU family sensor histidine kinase
MKTWASTSVYWRAQIVGWALISIVALIERQLLYHSLLRAIVVTLFVTPVMIIFSEILRNFYDRTALYRSIDLVSSSIIFLSSLVAGLLSTLIVVMVFQFNKWTIPGWTLSIRIAIPFIQNWLIFSGWSLLYLWISAEVSRKNESERAAKAEAEKLKVELQKLRLQLNPHFLFNTLSSFQAGVMTACN